MSAKRKAQFLGTAGLKIYGASPLRPEALGLSWGQAIAVHEFLTSTAV
jgi:hypothetical protein